MIPAQFRVLVIRRPKYACRACEEEVVQAPAPARLIEGGLPTEGLVAQCSSSKYADHSALPPGADLRPPGRQVGPLDAGRLGWPRRVPATAGIRAAVDIEGVAKLFADETTAPVLDPGRGRTKTGQLLAYARDDRPWGGATRRSPSTYTRRTARRRGQSRISPASTAPCRSTATAPTRRWPRRGKCGSLSAGAMSRRPFYELARRRWRRSPARR